MPVLTTLGNCITWAKKYNYGIGQKCNFCLSRASDFLWHLLLKKLFSLKITVTHKPEFISGGSFLSGPNSIGLEHQSKPWFLPFNPRKTILNTNLQSLYKNWQDNGFLQMIHSKAAQKRKHRKWMLGRSPKKVLLLDVTKKCYNLMQQRLRTIQMPQMISNRIQTFSLLMSKRVATV